MYFGKMKFQLIVTFILVSVGFGSCKKAPFDGMDEFRKNKFDLKLTQSFDFQGIEFKMPTHFYKENLGNFVIKIGDFSGRDSSLNTFFSIEMFTPEEWNEIIPEDSMPAILDLHDINIAYLSRRYKNYYKAGISSTSRLKLSYPNQFQVIATKALETSVERYFAMATIEVKNKFYIFQYAASPQLMEYVCDDFKRILKSVKKK